MAFSDIYLLYSPSPPCRSLFHGLASLRALDQRSIVSSDSMDDAEAAGARRGGRIVVVELSSSLRLRRAGQFKRK